MEENIKIEAQEEGVKEPQDTKVVEKDNSVPFSRFNEVIAERNKLREDMESLNKEMFPTNSVLLTSKSLT